MNFPRNRMISGAFNPLRSELSDNLCAPGSDSLVAIKRKFISHLNMKEISRCSLGWEKMALFENQFILLKSLAKSKEKPLRTRREAQVHIAVPTNTHGSSWQSLFSCLFSYIFKRCVQGAIWYASWCISQGIFNHSNKWKVQRDRQHNGLKLCSLFLHSFWHMCNCHYVISIAFQGKHEYMSYRGTKTSIKQYLKCVETNSGKREIKGRLYQHRSTSKSA